MTGGAVIPQIGNPRKMVSYEPISATVSLSGGSNPVSRSRSAWRTVSS